MSQGLVLGLGFALGLFILFASLDRGRSQPATDLEERLKGYGGETLSLDEQELQASFQERILAPIAQRVTEFIASRTPDAAKDALWAKIQLAGSPPGLTPAKITAYKYIAAPGMAGLGLFVGLMLHSPLWLIGAPLGGGALGYYLPTAWLNQKASKRREEIQLSLPDALDLLTIAVEAGLSFEAAMSRVMEKFHNALTDEFAQVLQETKLGRPRADAMEDMGFRCGVEDLHNFVQAVVQSEQMGVGVAKILRIQSDEMRRKRRQRAQEKGAQATLKMMMPMIGCIFPTIWIVLLGPAILGFLVHKST